MIVLTVGNASAWFGPFEIKNETFYDGEWGIVDEHGTPDKITKSSGHVRGWVGIVGFENMSVLDGVNYVNESPHKVAIVKKKAWHTKVSGKVRSFKTSFNVVDTDYTDGNDTTTATLHTIFKWKYKVNCDPVFGCDWDNAEDKLTVVDVVDSPEVFNNSLGNYTVIITSYNNSVTPYTLIYLPPRWNIIKETVVYKNSSASWCPVLGVVKTNANGTEYVDFIDSPLYVADTDHVIMRVDDYYVINEAPLDWGALEISVQTPYVLVDDLAWHVVVVHSKPSDYIAWKLIVVFVFVLGVFLVAGYYAVNAGRV